MPTTLMEELTAVRENSKKTRPIRVAILGHHGIPSNYGGFETFAEEIGKQLVERGLAVTGYCRSNYFTTKPKEYRGIKLVYIPTIINKYLDTFVHTFLSVLHLLIRNTAKIVIMVNIGNAPWAMVARLCGKKVIFCVDGMDWERKKWGRFAKWYLRVCSYLAPLAAQEVVTDAVSVQEFYKNSRHTISTFIPYGTATDATPADTAILKELNLENKKYFIYVARFEPENNPLGVVRAYVASGSRYPLVMVGDNRYSPDYVTEVKAAGNKNVLFLGYVFGQRYKELVKGALAFIRAAEVGGSAPTTIEASGRGTCVMANDKPVNREVLGDTAEYYNINNMDTLTTLLRAATAERLITLGEKARARAELFYSWEHIADDYVALIHKLARREGAVKNTLIKWAAYTRLL